MKAKLILHTLVGALGIVALIGLGVSAQSVQENSGTTSSVQAATSDSQWG